MSDPRTLTAWVLAATVEQELIRLEADAGDSVAFANRPLNPAEKAAKTKFGDLDAIVTHNTEEGRPYIAALYAALAAAVVMEAYDLDPDEDDDGVEDPDATAEVSAIVAALYLMRSKPPKLVQEEKTKTTKALTGLIEDSFTGGVATILDEAKRQGQDIERWVRPGVPDIMTVLATDVTDHAVERFTDRGINHYTSPQKAITGTVTRGELEAFVGETTQDGTVDRLHQANQSALGVGRVETAKNYTGEFLIAYASEIMDKSTCGPCTAVDGTRYDSLEDAEEDYPTGTYVACHGGSRCRGTIVVIFDVPPDEDDDNDPAWRAGGVL